ncbi:type I-E CRISPR-associated endoribonuclease Cas2e [Loigolactobacillus bifermentans]|uniref:DNA polymerase III polC-type n=1 Tax=Loigolactobacillus bifermentans DSM 20003 TaxID=1423726 RepID=A0A0R1H7R8_9LACO|nr:type I-E CRISPR-associated endoribonuclease Cas2e [Loigolactobacillus bifermentans]KRK39921.1 3-5 exonuclease [Loigolactobacillus bifermentans DSM 20003]QGG61352.1 type I-E CRISPR-associated endoribonuclease Cas2 [Loigolactobacillus bifermentans]
MIVITLTKVPPSLRGDLTKWYQEIQTGVYVGNVSAKIRDALWERIMRDIGNGQATMVYNTNNELGYIFKTTRVDRAVVDYEGIPLMMHLKTTDKQRQPGFSNAAKFHKAKVMSHQHAQHTTNSCAAKAQPFVAIDLETTGLDVTQDKIIAIGAAKMVHDQYSQFYQLIKIDTKVPSDITKLTAITSEMLESEGILLTEALEKLKKFIADLPIVGYNSRFDMTFLANSLRQAGLPPLSQNTVDLMPIVKKENKFIDNYRLSTVLPEYEIKNKQSHHALWDAAATLELATKLIEKQSLVL